MDDDACSCIRARTTLAWPSGIAGAAVAEAALSAISDSLRNPDKRWHRSKTGRLMSWLVVTLMSQITMKNESPGHQRRVNKPGVMSKMRFPALEKSSSLLVFYLVDIYGVEFKEISLFMDDRVTISAA